MEQKKTFSQRMEQFFAGKGFYVVLLLCVAVIGISSWILLTDQGTYGEQGEDPSSMDVSVINPNGNEETDVFTDIQDPEDESVETGTTSTAAPTMPTYTPEVTATPEAQNQAETGDQETIAEENGASEGSETVAETYVWPVAGEIEVPYSIDALVYNKTMSDWRTHDGVDIAAEMGTQVMATAEGRVESVVNDPLYGTTVVLDHGGGLKSSYSNLSEVPTVAEGDTVVVGEIIGAVGDTALCEAGEVSHLHFSMSLDGVSVDPGNYMP
jgi:murein DD-endopeptidase MepM/ murein hydrolase activator NlpD